jgi:hypothetical protein
MEQSPVLLTPPSKQQRFSAVWWGSANGVVPPVHRAAEPCAGRVCAWSSELSGRPCETPRTRVGYVHSHDPMRITWIKKKDTRVLMNMRKFILSSACNGDRALEILFRCGMDSKIIAMDIAERLLYGFTVSESQTIAEKGVALDVSESQTIADKKVALIAAICMTIAHECNEIRPDYKSSDEAYRDWFKKSFEHAYDGLKLEKHTWLLELQQEKMEMKKKGNSDVKLLSLYEMFWSEMKWEICSQIGFYVDFLTPSTWNLISTVITVDRFSEFCKITLENIVLSSYGYIYEDDHQSLCSLGSVRKAHPDAVAMACFLIFLDKIPEGDMVQYVTFMIGSRDNDFETIRNDEENLYTESLDKSLKRPLERSLKRCIFARLQHCLYGTVGEDKQLYTDTCESPLLDPIRQFILRVHEQDTLDLEKAYGINKRSPSPEF